MTGEQLKKSIQQWGRKVGYREARVVLVSLGLGFSTVEKLLGGSYAPTPKARVREILEKALQSRPSKEQAS